TVGPGQLVVVGGAVTGVTLAPTSAELVLRSGSTIDHVVNGGVLTAQGGGNGVVLSYTSLPGSTLRVAAAVVLANAQLTTPGFTNHGLIELTNSFGQFESRLTLGSGNLINASD